MAGGHPRHHRIATNITGRLFSALDGTSCQVFNSDMRVHIPATTLYTYPNATVVCGEPVFFQTDNLLNPALIVEVRRNQRSATTAPPSSSTTDRSPRSRNT